MIMALLNPRFMAPLHFVQLTLVLAVVILSVVRMLMPGPRTTGRGGTIALGMGAKSLVIILYQIGSRHWGPMKRWASLKAYAILNTIEIVFWGAVVFLTIQSNIQICVGTSCIIGWVISSLAIVVTLLCVYVSAISIREYRYPDHKNQELRLSSSTSDNERGDEHALNKFYHPRIEAERRA